MKIGKMPKLGEQREVVRFAWWPVTLDNRDIIWLEKYKTVEMFVDRWMNNPTWVVHRRLCYD